VWTTRKESGASGDWSGRIASSSENEQVKSSKRMSGVDSVNPPVIGSTEKGEIKSERAVDVTSK
jgi:hypothetical protein